MTEIDRAEKEAMRVLNGWVDALMPKFNAIEMMALKQRLTAAFRTYETDRAQLKQETETCEKLALGVNKHRDRIAMLQSQLQAMRKQRDEYREDEKGAYLKVLELITPIQLTVANNERLRPDIKQGHWVACAEIAKTIREQIQKD